VVFCFAKPEDAGRFRERSAGARATSARDKYFVNFHSRVREIISREVRIPDFVAGIFEDSSPGSELVQIPKEAFDFASIFSSGRQHPSVVARTGGLA
jgi:hypothetical protein